MHSRFARRAVAGFSAVALATLAAACRDKRLDTLHVGMPRDSVLALINQGESDSLARVYKQETYFLQNLKGNVQYGNILFYNRKGTKEADQPKLERDAATPIVLADGKVIGWGWTFYDSVATINKFPANNFSVGTR